MVVSENMPETGKFFGEVNPFIMELLVHAHFYSEVNIVDYQGVCFEAPKSSNPASIIQNVRFLKVETRHVHVSSRELIKQSVR